MLLSFYFTDVPWHSSLGCIFDFVSSGRINRVVFLGRVDFVDVICLTCRGGS